VLSEHEGVHVVGAVGISHLIAPDGSSEGSLTVYSVGRNGESVFAHGAAWGTVPF